MPLRGGGSSLQDWLRSNFGRWASGIDAIVTAGQTIASKIQAFWTSRGSRTLPDAVRWIQRAQAAAEVLTEGTTNLNRNNVPLDPTIPAGMKYRVWVRFLYVVDSELKGVQIAADFDHVPTADEVEQEGIQVAKDARGLSESMGQLADLEPTEYRMEILTVSRKSQYV